MPLHTVLIAQDATVDLPAIRVHLKKNGFKNPVLTFTDGEDLLSFLRAALTAQAATVRPCLLLLDLDLPNSNGFELVRWMRQQEPLKDLSVIILARTIDPKDVKRAAALGITQFGAKQPSARITADLIIKALSE